MNVSPTSNPMDAARAIYGSDGFDTGIYFQADLPVYNAEQPTEPVNIDTIEEGFLV